MPGWVWVAVIAFFVLLWLRRQWRYSQALKFLWAHADGYQARGQVPPDSAVAEALVTSVARYGKGATDYAISCMSEGIR
jgi:hypothetical protein